MNDGKDKRTDAKPSEAPPKSPHPDDVAVKPEHPGNIPAGTPGNPVEWGEPYEVDENADETEMRRRRETPGQQGDPKKPSV